MEEQSFYSLLASTQHTIALMSSLSVTRQKNQGLGQSSGPHYPDQYKPKTSEEKPAPVGWAFSIKHGQKTKDGAKKIK